MLSAHHTVYTQQGIHVNSFPVYYAPRVLRRRKIFVIILSFENRVSIFLFKKKIRIETGLTSFVCNCWM